MGARHRQRGGLRSVHAWRWAVRSSTLLGVLILPLWLSVGCSVRYSFTGASIPPDVHTVSVMPFPNLAPLVNPTLSSALTEALKDRFLQQTRLGVQDYDADFQFSGEIVGYSVEATAIQSNELAALNRLTISVRVRFLNTKDETANFDRTFSAYEDFSAELAFQQAESALVDQIVEKLVADIFNAAVANW